MVARRGRLTSKVGWNRGDGDTNDKGGGKGFGGRFKAERNIGGAAECELGYAVGGLSHDAGCVEFEACGVGQRQRRRRWCKDGS